MGFSVRLRVELGLSTEYSGVDWRNGVDGNSTFVARVFSRLNARSGPERLSPSRVSFLWLFPSKNLTHLHLLLCFLPCRFLRAAARRGAG